MPSTVWSDLVVSILAVNNYSLEKALSHADSLEKHGILKPEKLAKMSHEEVFEALEASGYRRGNMTGIFTDRLLSLGEHVKAAGAAKLEENLAKIEPTKIKEALPSVKGIGPRVVENYVIMRSN